MKDNRWILTVLLVSLLSLTARAAIEELIPQVTVVAPGVYRLRAGEPEAIVPSIVRAPAAVEAMSAMPKISEPPLPVASVKFWRMDRGCRIELPFNNNERIYGLGLQCKSLIQNGWRKTLLCAPSDADSKGKGHAPVPFYASTAGYGVLVDSARYLTFSIGDIQRLSDVSALAARKTESKTVTDIEALYGAEHREVASVYVDVPVARGVDVYLFAGPNTGQAVARYNLFSGGGCMPALSGMGPYYIFGTMLDSKAVQSMCEQLKTDRIAVTTIGLEPGWQTHAYASSYMFKPAKFPPDFGAIMRNQGYDLNLWTQMYIDSSSPLISLLGKNIGDFECMKGVVPDVASTEVRSLFCDFLAQGLLRQGVAGFKLDEADGSGNRSSAYKEWQFPEITSFPSGADGETMHNLLGRLGIQCIGEAFRKVNRRTFSLVRASQAWAAPLPFSLYSDEYNFADYMRYNLSAGVQGLLWAPEVRDAKNEREWALRVGAAAFSARMLYNGWQFPNLEWRQPNLAANQNNRLLPDDNAFKKIARRFNNLRMALIPYLYQAYGDYHHQGISPVRPLICDWPQDTNTHMIDDEWMLGPDLLVAPLTDENSFGEGGKGELNNTKTSKLKTGESTQRPRRINAATAWNREVYLPDGNWRDFWTGAMLKGGERRTLTATPERPLVFVRDGTLLALAEPVVTMDSNTVFKVHLAVYGDSPRPCQLREDDGTTFDFEKGKWATLTVKPDGTMDRPDHGQPLRYRIAGKAEAPESVLRNLIEVAQ